MITDLHPEELLERAVATGVLSRAERRTLDRHLAQCEACRVERRIRTDSTHELALPSSPEWIASMADGAAGRFLAERGAGSSQGRWAQTLGGVTAGGLVAGLVLAVTVSAADSLWPTTRRGEPPGPSQAVDVRGGAVEDRVARRRPVNPPAQRNVPRPVPPPVPPAAASGAVDGEVAGIARVEPRPPRRGRAVTPRRPRAAAEPVLDPNARTEPQIEPQIEPRIEPSAAQLFASAMAVARTGDADRALSLFVRTIEAYPASREAKTALVLSARLRLEARGDPRGALDAYTRYLRQVPSGSLRPEAMAGQARALERLGRFEEATAIRARLSQLFPDSAPARAPGR